MGLLRLAFLQGKDVEKLIRIKIILSQSAVIRHFKDLKQRKHMERRRGNYLGNGKITKVWNLREGVVISNHSQIQADEETKVCIANNKWYLNISDIVQLSIPSSEYKDHPATLQDEGDGAGVGLEGGCQDQEQSRGNYTFGWSKVTPDTSAQEVLSNLSMEFSIPVAAL